VAVLSDMAELAEDVDLSRAQGAKDRAEEALRADADDEVASAALRRAEVRILVAEAATKR
jgi:F-type H+-transporting ATPase subunit epsilon